MTISYTQNLAKDYSRSFCLRITKRIQGLKKLIDPIIWIRSQSTQFNRYFVESLKILQNINKYYLIIVKLNKGQINIQKVNIYKS
ncbi:hypothetical protein BpHYR1_004050 [Brachionus plicatilis]|uniref:Uncharacterized protein n=1 Tax=Brachionus plicatilis TaxID=10195 RepID=A0A3M7RS45_BRAPC|nr:hypothetical protein BpHYR1_004050 [Brachionus plicatilis]